MKRTLESNSSVSHEKKPRLEIPANETVILSLEEHKELLKRAEEGKNITEIFKDWANFKKTQTYSDFIVDYNDFIDGFEYNDAFFHSDIVLAVVSGYSKIVKFYIENKVYDINYSSQQGYSLLHMAIGGGAHFETIKVLMEADIDINKQLDTKNGSETALELLINKDFFLLEEREYENIQKKLNHELIKYLIANNADIDFINNNGSKILFDIEDIDDLKFLLNIGVKIKANNKGVTPLHKAYNFDKVKVLSENISDVNILDNEGNTLIHYRKSDEALEFLIKLGLNVNQPNNEGKTPLHKLFVDTVALKDGDDKLEAVKVLIKNNADVNIKDKENLSPFQTIIKAIQPTINYIYPLPDTNIILNILKLFIDANADVNEKDSNDKSPLHNIVTLNISERSNLEILYAFKLSLINLLINANADLNIQNIPGETPLHFAKDPEVVQILIESGADFNIKNIIGQTPLFFANNPEIVKILVENGADINAIDNDSNTPLLYNLKFNYSNQNVMGLLKLGAKFDENINFNRFYSKKLICSAVAADRVFSHMMLDPILDQKIRAIPSIEEKEQLQDLFISRLKFNCKQNGIKGGYEYFKSEFVKWQLVQEGSPLFNKIKEEITQWQEEYMAAEANLFSILYKIAPTPLHVLLQREVEGQVIWEKESQKQTTLDIYSKFYPNLFHLINLYKAQVSLSKYILDDGQENIIIQEEPFNSPNSSINIPLNGQKLIDNFLFTLKNCSGTAPWPTIKNDIIKEIGKNHILKEKVLELSKCILPPYTHNVLSELMEQVKLVDKFVHKIYHNHKNNLALPSLDYEDLCIAEFKYKLLKEGVPCKYSTFVERIKAQADNYSPKLWTMAKAFQAEIVNQESRLINHLNPDISKIPLIDLLQEHNTSKWGNFDKKVICEFYSGLYPNCSNLLGKYISDIELSFDKKYFTDLDRNELVQKLKDNAGSYIASFTEEQIWQLDYNNYKIHKIIHHIKDIPLPCEFKIKFDEIFDFQKTEDLDIIQDRVTTVGEIKENIESTC